MTNISKFEVHGPNHMLKRMGDAMHKDTPHLHCYKTQITNQYKLWVFLYEDQNTAVQSSRCVTCILSEGPSLLYIEIADVGKQSGFRGSQGLDDQPVYDQILDFILDFSKQFGLTVKHINKE